MLCVTLNWIDRDGTYPMIIGYQWVNFNTSTSSALGSTAWRRTDARTTGELRADVVIPVWQQQFSIGVMITRQGWWRL
ncbi:MAG: hypothetical protein MUF87_08595 [Anaerolineae bacterium]|nr:hypothetical protein [Anaerolineae bacterium]